MAILPHKIFELFSDSRRLFTKNLVPGKYPFDEKHFKEGSIDFREWDPTRSKVAACIAKGVTNIGLRKGDIVLYLGVSHGYTASFISDMIGSEGIIFGVDPAPRVVRDLIFLSHDRKNIVPLLCDANHPEEYQNRICEPDIIIQDVAQRNQAEIFLKNCALLKKGGYGLLAVKARSIDAKKPSKQIFEEVRKQIEEKLTVIDFRNLDPYEKDHCMIIIKNEAPGSAKAMNQEKHTHTSPITTNHNRATETKSIPTETQPREQKLSIKKREAKQMANEQKEKSSKYFNAERVQNAPVEIQAKDPSKPKFKVEKKKPEQENVYQPRDNVVPAQFVKPQPSTQNARPNDSKRSELEDRKSKRRQAQDTEFVQIRSYSSRPTPYAPGRDRPSFNEERGHREHANSRESPQFSKRPQENNSPRRENAQSNSFNSKPEVRDNKFEPRNAAPPSRFNERAPQRFESRPPQRFASNTPSRFEQRAPHQSDSRPKERFTSPPQAHSNNTAQPRTNSTNNESSGKTGGSSFKDWNAAQDARGGRSRRPAGRAGFKQKPFENRTLGKPRRR